MPPRVIVSKRFGQYHHELERAVDRALGRSAGVAKAAAKSKPTSYNIGAILDEIEVEEAKDYKGGREVHLVAKDWRSTFFELGTYKRRRRKLKQPRRSTSTRKGVKPGYFLSRGLRAGKAVLLRELEFQIGRIR